MTVVVVGATGFIGSAITCHLLQAGFRVHALTRSSAKAKARFAELGTGQQALAEGRLTFAEADVTRPDTLVDALGAAATATGEPRGLQAVIQASQFEGAPVENPRRGLTYAAVDYGGTVNLLGALTQLYGVPTASLGETRFPQDAPRFFYLSGITVSEEANEPWNQAKWQAEKAIRQSGLMWTIVRCCWAYGPEDRALNRLLSFADRLPFLPVFGSGNQPLTPVFVEDVGRFFALLAAKPHQGRDTTFGLGGPDLVTMNDFLRLALKAKGKKRPLLHIPASLGKLAGSMVQYLPGRPLTPAAVEFMLQGGAVTSDDRKLLAERYPEFTPTRLEDGLHYLRKRFS
ncbi:MAG: SDR family NAD(P)-dependent oxidoreductase [Thermoleophilia bacterium]|nr:SDR family NAD(P)-dependent oxidoreductase [Thermoleophilia bacterium]